MSLYKSSHHSVRQLALRFLTKFIFVSLLSTFAYGAPANPVTQFNTFGVKYQTWYEQLDVERGNASTKGHSQFIGTGIFYEKEEFRNRLGYGFGAGVLFGQAHGEITTLGSEYLAVGKPWQAFQVRATGEYRLDTKVTLGIAGFAFYRTNPWPKMDFDNVQSGNDFNGGALLIARYRLGRNFEFQQEIGTILVKAKTYWSLGAHWKF